MTTILNVPKPKEIFVTLKASSFLYDAVTDAYQVKFSESKLIANDTSRQSVIVLIPSSKVQANSQTQQLKDEDIDTILDEIAAKERYKKYKRKSKKNEPQPSNATMISLSTATSNTSMYHTPNPSDFPSPTKGNSIKHDISIPPPDITKHNNTKSQKEKLAAKLASIPKPRKQAKIDIEPNKPRPRSPVASARSPHSPRSRSRDRDRETPRDDMRKHTLSVSPRGDRKISDASKRSSRKSDRSLPKPAPRAPVSIKNLPDLDNTKLTNNMKKEWLLCCHDDIRDDQCRGDDGAGCNAMKRVKFILHHYSLWMKYKSFVQNENGSDDDSSDGDSSDGDNDEDGDDIKRTAMRNYEWISDFMAELGCYSYVELSDDFEHIRDHHMKLNKNKTTQTITYFDTSLGKCTDKECSCLARHCRDRHIDNINEKKRREIFFIKYDDGSDDDKKGKKGGDGKTGKSGRKKKKIIKKNTVKEQKMYSEINLQTKLDTIHITLRHHHLRLINTDKFITKIYGNDGEALKDGNNNKSGKKDQNESTVNNMDDNKEEDIFRRMTKYSFGESITYWDSKHHRYCNSKYNDLRNELLNNKIYPLSQDLYNTIKNRAVSFLKTKKGQKIVAKREHDWMKKWKILKNSIITVDHVIALLCYVNVTALRRVFKLHGFVRVKKDDIDDENDDKLAAKKDSKKNYESRDTLLSRHREIWHWSRLLLECVHCYGIPLSSSMNYYHGIDCKLLFNRFNVMFDIPTSLTLNRDIAYNLSRTINYGRGIAIELSHGGLSDLQSLSLDLSYLSDYPSEEEQLIFHSYLSFNDVIINRMHHDEWLKILRFWYKIKEGFFFNHLIENNKITRNDQLCICAMIINMIINNPKHPRYDNRIPKYMQNLFNECVENNTFVWIIQSEYKNMIKKLQNLLYFDSKYISKSSQFIQYLIKYKKCNVCNANIFDWKIGKSEFDILFDKSKKNKWIVSPSYTVFMGDQKEEDDDDDDVYNNNKLVFHFECQNKAKNNLFRCRIHLDEKPDNVAKINLGMGLFCAKANNFDNYSYGELRYDKLYNVSLHSLFQTKILKKNCKKKEFSLKLQIQLFYVYDFNGKLISINQSQGNISNNHKPITNGNDDKSYFD